MSKVPKVSKRILEMNEQRESWCMVEARNDVTWLRPQKRHFLPIQHMATAEIKETATSDTGRSSWSDLSHPVHIQKRHFPQRNNSIFG
ncbi:spermatogenesis-associated protein 45 [Dromiciops gliroides]|uniref:spermatogenesis-associated protein 45 n=1 Tax=Dromiciops gliroides TaxID=33562 RepID=UPI001CC334E2|nr:spermatogenesis-associated protein 45 [Dromiciops gliroides]